MKNLNALFSTFVLVLILGLFSCGGGASAEADVEAQKMIEKVDSIGVEMEKSAETIETKTEEMKEEVDALLEGI